MWTGATGWNFVSAALSTPTPPEDDDLNDEHGHPLSYRIIAISLVVASVGVPGACSDDRTTGEETTTNTTTTEGPDIEPVEGGELVFAVDEVATLAPGEVAQASETLIALGIYDPLTTYVDGKIAPFLAESIESNEELTQYSVTLREGVAFHDDTPLDADAVVKHFDRLKHPATACRCFATLGQITSMETPDGPGGRTVIFNLATPSVTFPDLLAGSSGYIESPTSVAGGLDLRTGGVGSGPFMLTESSPGERFVLEANPNYWGKDDEGTPLPYLDRLTVVPMPDSEARLTALAAGAIDILQTTDSKTIKQAEDTGMTVQKLTGSSSTTLLFNNAKPPFDDLRARRAVAYSIDKSIINARGYEGVRSPSHSDFDLDSPYYNPEAGTPQYDPEQARTLVDELGGLRFTITCVSTPETNLVMELFKEFGEAAGMEITLEVVERSVFGMRVRDQTGQYEAACYRSSHFIEPDAIRPGLTTGDGGNLVFYSNNEVDQLLDEARRASDFEERKARYFRVQEITAAEVPLLTTVYDLFGNVYNGLRVGPPPPGEPNTQGAIKPGLLYATNR